MPMSYFNSRRTGDIQRRLSSMRNVREFVVGSGLAALAFGSTTFDTSDGQDTSGVRPEAESPRLLRRLN